MGQRSIRFSDELEARIEAVARRDDRSFSYVVTKTMERALESTLSGSAPKGASDDGARTSPDRLKSDDSPSASSRTPDEPVATVLGSPVRKSRKTPSLKDTWGR